MPLLPTSSNEGREGERNGLALWREIKAQGYTGSDRSVYRHLATLKPVEVKASVNVERIQQFSANTAIWLFMRDPKKLDEIEREDLTAFCQASAPLKTAYDLLQDFLSMVHKREGHRLDAWLARGAESRLPELQSFATGVEKDKEAVQAGLTWPINNGMVARAYDQIETHQANNVWQSWLCSAPPTGASCRIEEQEKPFSHL